MSHQSGIGTIVIMNENRRPIATFTKMSEAMGFLQGRLEQYLDGTAEPVGFYFAVAPHFPFKNEP